MTSPHRLGVLLAVTVAVTAAPVADAASAGAPPQRLALVVTRVVDGKGQPLPGAEVSLVRCYGERRYTSVPSFTLGNPTGVPIEPDRDNCDIVSEATDAEGIATFPNVRVGDTRITVARDSTVRYLLRTVKEGYTRGRRIVTPHVARNDYNVVLYRTVGERMFELVDEARVAADAGDFADAEVALIQAIAMMRAEVAVRNLDTPDALLEAMRELTWVHLRAGNDVAARDSLEELLQLAPDDPFALRTAGVLAVQQQEWDIAEALFDTYLMFHADSADAYLMKGNLYLELGPAQTAVDHLEQAVELDPELALAYRSLGIAYERVGRLEDAIESLHRYLELAVQPTDAVQIRATIAMLRR